MTYIVDGVVCVKTSHKNIQRKHEERGGPVSVVYDLERHVEGLLARRIRCVVAEIGEQPHPQTVAKWRREIRKTLEARNAGK